MCEYGRTTPQAVQGTLQDRLKRLGWVAEVLGALLSVPAVRQLGQCAIAETIREEAEGEV